MKRLDLSPYLIHWISAETPEDAFHLLHSIIIEGKIRGNTKFIKGGYSCVCFTETPIEHFDFNSKRYWPFGIRVSKVNVFIQGGRPVIYQHDSEFEDLPERIRWRHVRYEPDSEPSIDFTWEREWRIQTTEFDLDPDNITVIVPDRDAANELQSRFYQHEWERYQWELIGYGEILARSPESWIYSIKLIQDN